MKKILHILLISCFSFTIVSCAKVNSTMDDISNKYDEFSKESDETVAKDDQTTDSTISEKTPSSRSLFVSVGGKGTILTSSNGTKWTKRTSSLDVWCEDGLTGVLLLVKTGVL